jgi:hypothetical protein
MNPDRLERVLASLHETDPGSSVLHRLCVVSAATSKSDGAGISRLDGAAHTVLEVTNEQAATVESLQATFGEGPCIDAVSQGLPAFEPDLGSDEAMTRWPHFSPRALDCGIGAAFAFPLMRKGRPLGALDVYSERPRQLEHSQVDDLLLVADLASIAVESAGGSPVVEGTDLRTEGAEPWAHPAVVHHAVGMVSAQLGVGVDEALLRLRARAFALAQPVEALARDVIERRTHARQWGSGD